MTWLSFSAHLHRSHGPVSEKSHYREKKYYFRNIFFLLIDRLREILAVCPIGVQQKLANCEHTPVPKDKVVKSQWSFL